jgi:hypothetical protein
MIGSERLTPYGEELMERLRRESEERDRERERNMERIGWTGDRREG